MISFYWEYEKSFDSGTYLFNKNESIKFIKDSDVIVLESKDEYYKTTSLYVG